jgi:ATP-dependent Clp protease ATP-binding subunit ClpC
MTAFTEEAREAVVLSRTQAREFGQDRVGTEHLLLGLLDVMEGLAARVLGSLDVTAEAVRNQVLQMGAPGKRAGPAEDITVVPRSRKVLELALREAIILDFSAAGMEHILLAISREAECVAAGILRRLVSAADHEIRNAVIRALSDTHPQTLRTQPVPFQATPRNVL